MKCLNEKCNYDQNTITNLYCSKCSTALFSIYSLQTIVFVLLTATISFISGVWATQSLFTFYNTALLITYILFIAKRYNYGFTSAIYIPLTTPFILTTNFWILSISLLVNSIVMAIFYSKLLKDTRIEKKLGHSEQEKLGILESAYITNLYISLLLLAINIINYFYQFLPVTITKTLEKIISFRFVYLTLNVSFILIISLARTIKNKKPIDPPKQLFSSQTNIIPQIAQTPIQLVWSGSHYFIKSILNYFQEVIELTKNILFGFLFLGFNLLSSFISPILITYFTFYFNKNISSAIYSNIQNTKINLIQTSLYFVLLIIFTTLLIWSDIASGLFTNKTEFIINSTLSNDQRNNHLTNTKITVKILDVIKSVLLSNILTLPLLTICAFAISLALYSISKLLIEFNLLRQSPYETIGLFTIITAIPLTILFIVAITIEIKTNLNKTPQ